MKGRMRLSLWVVTHSCNVQALAFADGYDEESADDSEGEPKGCRLVHGGAPVCHGRIVLCFP